MVTQAVWKLWHLTFDEIGKKKTFKHTGLSSGLTLIKKKRSYRSFCGLDKHSETSTDFLFFIFILHFE